MKIAPADFIPKCVEKLHADICNKEDELDEIYDKLHEAEEELESVRQTISDENIFEKVERNG